MLRRRYFRILLFFALTILNFIWWDIVLPHLGLRKLARATRSGRITRIARRFRTLAVQMGGVMIKVGQFLSARLDVLPREITLELAGLQDEVKAEPFEPIQAMIEAEFGKPLDQIFSEIDTTPFASASIGQVHIARLCITGNDRNQADVVVKVQRPRIEDIINVDLSAIRIVGGWLQKYKPIRKHANVPKLLDEFSQSLYEEIDYINEGKNAEVFAENFRDLPNVRVPKVIWSRTTKRVLTLENVMGIKITDYDAIEEAGIDRSAVAKRLFNTYLKQIFEDRFFHADPHPGNLFVQTPAERDDPENWVLTFVDFGMTDSLRETTYEGLREAVLAVGTQDAQRLIKSYQILDVLLPGADLDLLERASQRVFDRFWGKSTTQLKQMHAQEAREFMREFEDLLYEMPFQAPDNLILLGRCVSILSGICTGLDPEFNIFENLTPYAGKLIEKENGDRWTMIWNEVVRIGQIIIKLPARTDNLMTRLERGRLEVRVPALSREIDRLKQSQGKTTTAVIFAAFLLSGVQFYLADESVFASISGVVAFILLLWIMLRR
ncbi:MAG: AarF/UbiB family protein [Anaerolineaceae bacterium]|nr:AarF/UbiB family protein [Anaerolineaceae bacterium]